MRRAARAYPRAAALLWVLAAARADASIVFVDLGTAAPPTAVGPFAVTAYDQSRQSAIPDRTNVRTIPGSPIAPGTTTSFRVQKRTVGESWSSWSHGYAGPVFYTVPLTPPLTLTIAPARAFYAYVEPAAFGGPYAVAVSVNGGAATGTALVDAAGGATGFAFYTTADESLTSVTIDADPDAEGFAFGELGLGVYGIGTPSPTPTPRPTVDSDNACSLSGRGEPSAAWLAACGALVLWRLARAARR